MPNKVNCPIVKRWLRKNPPAKDVVTRDIVHCDIPLELKKGTQHEKGCRENIRECPFNSDVRKFAQV